MISLSKRPSSVACSARCWLRAPKASRSSRERPHLSAMISAEMPCGHEAADVGVAQAHGVAEREADAVDHAEAPIGTRLMTSTPAATTMS